MYARRSRNRIYYRVVDEYEGGTLTEKTKRTSTRPLSLGELEAFFNGAWSIFDVLEMNGFECDLENSLAFVEGVESEFYPDLDQLYRHRIGTWVEERRRERGLEKEKTSSEVRR